MWYAPCTVLGIGPMNTHSNTTYMFYALSGPCRDIQESYLSVRNSHGILVIEYELEVSLWTQRMITRFSRSESVLELPGYD
jgi:hypothetical protein